MTIDPIVYRPYPLTPYDFNPETAFDSNIINKKQQEKYYSDTLAPFLASSLAPNAPNLETTGALNLSAPRPSLERPEIDTKQLKTFFSNVNHHLIHEIETVKEAVSSKKINEAEYGLLSLLFKCLAEQKEHNEQESLIIFETIKQKQAANQKLGQEYFAHLDDMISRTQTSEKLGWVSWILSGTVILGGLASIALTWGVSAPAVITTWLTIGNAIGAIGAGGTKIAQGVYDYNSKLVLGEIKELEFIRQHQNEKINISMEEMKHAMEVVAAIMQQMNEILYNVQQASSSMR